MRCSVSPSPGAPRRFDWAATPPSRRPISWSSWRDVGGRVLAGEVRDRQRVLAAIGAAAQAPGAHGADGDRLDRGRVAPDALGRLDQIEDAVVAIPPTVLRRGAGGLVHLGDPGLQLAVHGDVRLLGLGRGGLLQGGQERCGRMLALGVDEAGAGAGEPDPAAAAVGDVDPGQERRPPLATHPAGDRAPVALDVHLDDRLVAEQKLCPLPSHTWEQPLEVSARERQHLSFSFRRQFSGPRSQEPVRKPWQRRACARTQQGAARCIMCRVHPPTCSSASRPALAKLNVIHDKVTPFATGVARQ